MKGAVFLDRDGTINEEVNYLDSIDKLSLIPQAAKAVGMLNSNNIKAIVVTNQSGVARNFFSEEFLNIAHKKLKELLNNEGATFDALYYCPHHPDGIIEKYKKKCTCRKPETGMVDQAAREMKIDLKKSYVIGDKISETELAHRVGAKGILVLTGYGQTELRDNREKWTTSPDYIAKNLYDAVTWIIKDISEQ